MMKRVRNTIAKAIEMLATEGKKNKKMEFTVEEIWQYVHALEPSIKRSTVLGDLPDLCIDSENSHYKEEERFLKRVRQGTYKLYTPSQKPKKPEKNKEVRILGTIPGYKPSEEEQEQIWELFIDAVKFLKRKHPSEPSSNGNSQKLV
jgi:hypothetical protein